MNTIKDFQKALNTLSVQANKAGHDILIDAYKKRERSVFKGINEFLKVASSRSSLFDSLKKGALVVGVGLVAGGLGLDLIAGEAGDIAETLNNVSPNLEAAKEATMSMFNTGMSFLGGAGVAAVAKKSTDNSMVKVEEIRDGITSLGHKVEEKLLGLKP